jgi:hypothetical protein
MPYRCFAWNWYGLNCVNFVPTCTRLEFKMALLNCSGTKLENHRLASFIRGGAIGLGPVIAEAFLHLRNQVITGAGCTLWFNEGTDAGHGLDLQGAIKIEAMAA